MRKLGNILLEIEPLLQELLDDHELQHGDVYGLLRQYLEIHYPLSSEEYEDGSKPILYYGPKEYV